jgi:hypothetical protein
MPSQHRLSCGVVQQVVGIHPRAEDPADGPLSAKQQPVARYVQIEHSDETITLMITR